MGDNFNKHIKRKKQENKKQRKTTWQLDSTILIFVRLSFVFSQPALEVSPAFRTQWGGRDFCYLVRRWKTKTGKRRQIIHVRSPRVEDTGESARVCERCFEARRHSTAAVTDLALFDLKRKPRISKRPFI